MNLNKNKAEYSVIIGLFVISAIKCLPWLLLLAIVVYVRVLLEISLQEAVDTEKYRSGKMRIIEEFNSQLVVKIVNVTSSVIMASTLFGILYLSYIYIGSFQISKES